MLGGSLHGIGAILEHAFHPFVEEEARTVGELVHHARGQIIGERAPLWAGFG
jgi:hypothetical protein